MLNSFNYTLKLIKLALNAIYKPKFIKKLNTLYIVTHLKAKKNHDKLITLHSIINLEKSFINGKFTIKAITSTCMFQ